ncbi:ATP-dependent DNA helicase RecG [Bifidobacterium choloepi]|nr:ATP-dependent DNA helicase RecG [Bifidobacterium choloepi]
MVDLNTSIASLLTNKRRAGALKSLGIVTVGDALTYYPFRVTDPVPVRSLREATFGAKMACAVRVRGVRSHAMPGHGGWRLEVAVDDDEFAASRRQPGGVASLVFFSRRRSYVDWLSGRLVAGQFVVIAGTPSVYNDRLQFTHPELLTVAPPAPSNPDDSSVTSREDGRTAGGGGLRYDAATPLEALTRVCRPRPVYHATSRISSEHIHDTILGCLRLLAGLPMEEPDPQAAPAPMTSLYRTSAATAAALTATIPDILPERIRESGHYLHRADAFSELHDPDSVAAFRSALDTLRYEEAFICQAALLQSRANAADHAAWACDDVSQRDEFVESLPFRLTAGQRDVVNDIGRDMATDHPMQRLLQGEVGSGKTVVAIAAMLQATGSGHQAVLVAPTLVLAEQHYESISRQLAAIPALADLPVLLLTGGMKLSQRRKVLATAASGDPCIVIATHAAFSKTFQAPNLALAVIDEQHRFGVEQRETLRAKGEKEPHLLVMTATPIPRTAAMTWFGDLDISWLTELPGGRKPIRTFVVNESDNRLMASMFAHIRARIDAGERAYVICPRIEEDDAGEEPDDSRGGSSAAASRAAAKARKTGGEFEEGSYFLSDEELGEEDGEGEPPAPLHSVDEIFARLQKLPQFSDVAFARLTGRDDDATKKAVMDDFSSGRTPVLVATTVVEVGVDVPEASCIVIFDAERYGLSQLHQLRGRVGRGGTESWAFLVSRARPGTIAEERLAAIEGTLDGAEIAEKDLELRGAGDVLGDSQSGGNTSLKLLRVVKDAPLIEEARSQAGLLLDDDPGLAAYPELAGAVLDFTRGNEAFLTSN